MTMRVWILMAALGFIASGQARAESELALSLEEQLLEDLMADPLDHQLDRELFAPDAKPPEAKDSPQQQAGTAPEQRDELNRQLLRELGPAGVSGHDHPLSGITRLMRRAEQLISQTESGPQTQGVQNQIVANLEELLKQARSRVPSGCMQCKSAARDSQAVAARRPTSQPKQEKPAAGYPLGGRKPASKPVRDPNAAPGTSEAGRPDMNQVMGLVRERVLRDLWGELPERARQQMLELPAEQFLPKYELLIEQYFRRLAEQLPNQQR